MLKRLENLKESLENAPIVKKGDYNYFVHPISDGIPLVEPKLLKEISKCIADNIDLSKIDKIVAVESMGIHIATALSLQTGVPFLVIRKREYGLEGEKKVYQKTGYGSANLYINNINEGDNILLIDDVISTGGTLKALINSLNDININIGNVVAVIEKGEGRKVVEEELNISIMTLVKMDVIDGKVVIESLNY